MKKTQCAHIHTEASRQAHSPSYTTIMVDAFPRASSEWLLFNYSSGTTGEKAVPTILFFFFFHLKLHVRNAPWLNVEN